jgi:hypothetical protein
MDKHEVAQWVLKFWHDSNGGFVLEEQFVTGDWFAIAEAYNATDRTWVLPLVNRDKQGA